MPKNAAIMRYKHLKSCVISKTAATAKIAAQPEHLRGVVRGTRVAMPLFVNNKTTTTMKVVISVQPYYSHVSHII